MEAVLVMRQLYFVCVCPDADTLAGGIIYPILFHKLEPRIGFGWAVRTIGFFILATTSFSISILRVRVLPPQKRRLIQLQAWKEPPFVLFSVATFFGFMGFYFPFYYISTYAIENGIASENTAFYFLAMLNAGSIFGRIAPNALVDKVGALNVIGPMTLITSALAFSVLGIHSIGGLVAFSVLYGFFSGSFVSIPPAGIAGLTKDMRMFGTRMGMSFAFAGLGLLIGNPIAGQIVKAKGFEAAIGFCGATLLVGALFYLAARTAQVGWQMKTIV